MDDIKISSNRSFGIVFFVFFLLIALYPLTYGGEIRAWSVIISLIFLALCLLNKAWICESSFMYCSMTSSYKVVNCLLMTSRLCTFWKFSTNSNAPSALLNFWNASSIKCMDCSSMEATFALNSSISDCHDSS